MKVVAECVCVGWDMGWMGVILKGIIHTSTECVFRVNLATEGPIWKYIIFQTLYKILTAG